MDDLHEPPVGGLGMDTSPGGLVVGAAPAAVGLGMLSLAIHGVSPAVASFHS